MGFELILFPCPSSLHACLLHALSSLYNFFAIRNSPISDTKPCYERSRTKVPQEKRDSKYFLNKAPEVLLGERVKVRPYN